ncbi:MAG: carbamoyltransferase HypF [Deltaproteobacteria bacterium SG8_13]|nr:MAG: carbamoyltransferase HypF [Deltaproteobacteria bacterium SG8_13]
MSKQVVARKLEVNGIVQGVGFRPFVYNLANRCGLKGEVANTSSGVVICVEGARSAVEAFTRDLAEQPPPLAHIVEVTSTEVTPAGYTDFSITTSRGEAAMATLISPDVSICDDCRSELFDPADRRCGYPFINCTNCGPRYTIIDDIPYDRPNTSMKHFTMCGPCQSEYDDPQNRRFHAQPNACAACGPRVTLFDNRRNEVQAADPIAAAAELLRRGKVLAVKGLGGFHLAADAQNDAAVTRLRRLKHREEKPLALMAADPASIRSFAAMTIEEERLLTAIQRPIVLLVKKEPNAISKAVSPRNRYFGVMLPYTPLHYLLLAHGFAALVMTSGNLSEEPIAIDNNDAFERLAGIADFFLIHNRDIYLRSDDSIIRHAAGEARLVRRSRGYVPVPIFLKKKVPPILACGAELKNTVCITKGKMAFVSQHIGDLENLPTYDFLDLTIRHMKRILAVEPEIIAHDLHPDYLSTQWALQQPDVEKVAVQHHHAHIVSAMSENRIDGPVIGLSFDGTGYGPDHSVWGGEVLIADAKGFTRAAHLDTVPMPGSAAAIKQPWRMALSYLHRAFGEQYRRLELPLLRSVTAEQVRIIDEMMEKNVNAPPTSSLGRLFDGVAALVGLRTEVAFEGQAAMELEMIAADTVVKPYQAGWTAGDPLRVPTGPIIEAVVSDVLAGQDAAVISARFHQTLIGLFAGLCDALRKASGLQAVVLSGGVFQNAILLTGLIKALEQKRFAVYTQKLVPCNDGGISLGQAAVAAARARR